MGPQTFNLILSILQDNTVSHNLTFSSKGDAPVNNYQVYAKYTTDNHTVNKSLLKISHIPSTQMVEIYIGDKCIYTKQCNMHIGKISLNSTISSNGESDYIVKIIELCKSKTENVYLQKLTEMRNFLNELRNENQK